MQSSTLIKQFSPYVFLQVKATIRATTYTATSDFENPLITVAIIISIVSRIYIVFDQLAPCWPSASTLCRKLARYSLPGYWPKRPTSLGYEDLQALGMNQTIDIMCASVS